MINCWKVDTKKIGLAHPKCIRLEESGSAACQENWRKCEKKGRKKNSNADVMYTRRQKTWALKIELLVLGDKLTHLNMNSLSSLLQMDVVYSHSPCNKKHEPFKVNC